MSILCSKRCSDQTMRDTLSPRDQKDGKMKIKSGHDRYEEILCINGFISPSLWLAYHIRSYGKISCLKEWQESVEVDLASEFRYRNPILDANDLVIIISQSGETADSLAALREAKSQEIKTLGIVNVVGSSIAREADKVMYTWAGPEILIATT